MRAHAKVVFYGSRRLHTLNLTVYAYWFVLLIKSISNPNLRISPTHSLRRHDVFLLSIFFIFVSLPPASVFCSVRQSLVSSESSSGFPKVQIVMNRTHTPAFVACAPTFMCVRSAPRCVVPSGANRAEKPRGKANVGAYSISDSLRDSPQLNSTLMNAMRDYFGDDGRELQDYMKRPRTDAGDAMFRCVILGCGKRERELAQALVESGLMSGLYYCAVDGMACDVGMDALAKTTADSTRVEQYDLVGFAKWCVADAVFIGGEQQNHLSKESEAELAEGGITVFPHDVSAAIASGSMQVKECLLPLAEADEEDSEAEEELVE